MTAMSAEVVLRLVDQLSGPARHANAATRELTSGITALKKALKAFRADGVDKQIKSIGKAAREATSAASKLRGDLGRNVTSGFARSDLGLVKIAREAREASSALRAVRVEGGRAVTVRARPSRDTGHPRGHRDEGNSERNGFGAVAGVYAAHEAASFARESLSTYREFDDARRFSAAVMGIRFEDQKDLIRQAVHMGGTTKYNDIQVLEAQKELAARGLSKDAILGMIPAAGSLGMAMGIDLPASVRLMDQAIFSFKKSIGSVEEAARSAAQTADAEVKAAKISGMTPEDIAAVYRFGGTPAYMSGVSENTLLAFGGIEKRANISGDMAGTAFRALIAAAQAPTRGAKEALLANGLDYSKYQPKLTNIPLDPFVRNVAAQYGIHLNEQAKSALGKVFSDPKILNDQALFGPAVVKALNGHMSKKDLKSMRSIAGMAARFRNSIGGGADVNAFLADLMLKLPGNIKLANAIFGSKQGARIATALGDPEVIKVLKEQLATASGYAEKVAGDRMAGFDGAVSRFEGATKNLETAIGRAFDANGQGGLLTGVTSQVAKLVQSFAEASPHVQRLGVEAGIAAAGFAGFKGAEAILGGFGLKSSAVALTGAAEALSAAAGRLSLGGIGSALPGGAGAAGVAGRLLPKAVGAAGLIGVGITAATAMIETLGWYKDTHPDEFHAHAWAAYAKGGMLGAPLSGPYQPGKWEQPAGPNKGYARHFVPTGPMLAPAGFGGATGFGLHGFEAGATMIRSVASAARSAVPMFASAGTADVGALASGLEAGSGTATAAMTSLMASLASIAAGGVTVRVDVDTSGAEAKMAAAMQRFSRYGSGGMGGDARFSKGLNDTGQ